jgi:hypothetical protein
MSFVSLPDFVELTQQLAMFSSFMELAGWWGAFFSGINPQSRYRTFFMLVFELNCNPCKSLVSSVSSKSYYRLIDLIVCLELGGEGGFP